MSNRKKASWFLGLAVAAGTALSMGLVGCGGSGDGLKSEDLGNFVVPDYSQPPPDLSKVCVSKCTLDTDCQNSCVSPVSGISCCDQQTNTCYTAAEAVCPSAADASVSSPY